jgi:predicted DNA-binding protein with PD1-like motif
MKTSKCTTGADIFARLFELVTEKDVLKLDDGKYYEAHLHVVPSTHKEKYA